MIKDVLMNAADDGHEVHVDLQSQTISYNDRQIPFDVEEFRRHCLLNGLDDIDLTLQKENDITTFEKELATKRPWI